MFSKENQPGYKPNEDDYVPFDESQYVAPRVAARMFGVTSETIKSWEQRGRLHSRRTRGGHRRYAIAELDTLLAGYNGNIE